MDSIDRPEVSPSPLHSCVLRRFVAIVLISFPGLSVFAACEEQPSRSRPISNLESIRVPPSRPEVPQVPKNSWSTTRFVDDWGEYSGTGARSQEKPPASPMGFPYHDVMATLFVSCRSAWIRFTDSPNLTSDDIENGYDVYRLRVRLDGRDDRWRATQRWGSTDLNLPSSARSAWAAAKRFEVLLPWYGEGSVRFAWDLTGSADAIAKTCGKS